MTIGFLLTLLIPSVVGFTAREQTVQQHTSLLAKTWDGILNAGARVKSADTPVTRAVNLLKEMSVTLQKDMDDDQELFDKLSCWCRDNRKAKTDAINAANAQITKLENDIEQGTASSAQLTAKIKELEEETAANKDTLAKATALRQKELADFGSEEKAAVAAIANLKSAITVLSKHHGAALPQISMSFIQTAKKDEPWGMESADQRDLDMFMTDSSFDSAGDEMKPESRFLQQPPVAQPKVQMAQADRDDGWTVHDVATVQGALRSASAFVQSRGQYASNYVPAYSAQSGEIFGVLRQLQEDMQNDLSDAQKTEAGRASDFADLRSAKSAEVNGGWKSSEQKEDERAKTDNDLAEAKEDLGETKTTLGEDEKFLANLESTCEEATKNFDERKKSRQDEMTAVSDTIGILTDDEAKDAMAGTFKFIQISSQNRAELRRQAVRLLRRQAAETDNSEMALLATSAELNSFTKVKLMIDKMITTLNQQQADEVKKNDWCKSEIQSNDMATMKANDLQADLGASVDELKVSIKKFDDDVVAAKTAIGKEQTLLQQATIARKKENLDFQKNIADQTLTVEVLEKAMDRLATYYDEAALVQTMSSVWTESYDQLQNKPVPPVAQMTYKKSSGSTGVLSLIEKLIYDAKQIMSESKKAESEAQAGYEALVEDSNGTTKALTAQVLSKTDSRVEAHKDLTQKNQDLSSVGKDIGRLGKTDKDLHEDCDYVLKNFMVRQQARGEEVEALNSAKSILNGASA